MAVKRTYEFEILAKIDKALAGIEQLQSKSQKDLDSINFNTAVSAIVDGFHVIEEVASEVFNKVVEFTKEAVAAANENEEADIRLANALKLMGDNSVQAEHGFDALAASIASTTKFSDNAVKSSVALAKQYQLTNAEAAKVVRVATDLAAVQGTTLEEATKKLSATFGGFVDRDLARVIPGLKTMGLGALVAGDAIDKIAARVKGTAAALGNTFSGALTRVGGAFEKIQETIGDLIIKNPAIIAGLNALQKGLQGFNSELKSNSGTVKSLVTDGFLLLIQTAPAVIQTIQKIAETFNLFKNGVSRIGVVLGGFGASIADILKGGSSESSRRIFDFMNEDLDALDKNFFEAQQSSEKFFAPLIKHTQDLVANTTKAVEGARNLKDASVEATAAADQSNSGEAARRREQVEAFKKQIEDISKDPVTVGFDLFIRKKIDLTSDDKIALGAGIVNQVLKGAEGAKKAISAAIGGIADLLLPGIGGVVSEIVGVLAEGPEKVKATVTEFARAIPSIISNIVQALPVLIETLVRELPPALAKAMPQVAIGFSTALISHMPEIIRGFAEGLLNAAKEFVNALIDAITGGASDIFGSISGKGSGGVFEGIPVLGGIGDLFGFADGGRIADVPQFQNDGLPVKVSAKEQILGPDLSDDLASYLAENKNGGTVQRADIYIQMGLETFAKLSLEADRRGFRVRAT